MVENDVMLKAVLYAVAGGAAIWFGLNAIVDAILSIVDGR